MTITVELPDDVAQHPDPAREALEALVIAGYRTEALTASEARQMLGLASRYDFDGFLKKNQVFDFAYGPEDYAHDVAANRRNFPAGPHE